MFYLQEKPREIVFAYVMYIKQHYEAQEGGTLISIEELQPHLVVETNQGLKKPSETPIHFTPAYLNPIDLPKLLPGKTCCTLYTCLPQPHRLTETVTK